MVAMAILPETIFLYFYEDDIFLFNFDLRNVLFEV
jgi:hypothetical protein